MARTSYLRRPLTAVLIAAALAASVLMAAVMLASPAHAATFTVTNTNDSGPNSLRQAMLDANASGVGNTIDFAPGLSGPIRLYSGQLPVIIAAGGGLTIDGRGAEITIDQLAEERVFKVDNNAALTLDTLYVQNGYAKGPDGYGGGIYNNNGYLTVRNSTIAYNKADLGGGGIYNTGRVGWIEVSNTTITNNSAGRGGGGIFNDNTGEFWAWNTTIYENSVYNDGVPGSTQGGGGILLRDAAFAKLANTIVANNQVPSQEGPTFPNCRAGWGENISDAGNNIDSGTTCGFDNGSLSNTDPLLDPEGLQDNGGLTKTIALQPDSPAVDLVGEEACPPPETDQRGIERPQGDSCDSGAFELEQQAEPKTKAECKKGGHKEFGFKNQGQCIAFVNKAAHGR